MAISMYSPFCVWLSIEDGNFRCILTSDPDGGVAKITHKELHIVGLDYIKCFDRVPQKIVLEVAAMVILSSSQWFSPRLPLACCPHKHAHDDLEEGHR